MIDLIGESEINRLKNEFVAQKKNIADRITQLIEESGHDRSSIAWAIERKYSVFQITRYLNNSIETPIKKLIDLLVTIKSHLNEEFKDRKIKYILHPTWIRKHNEPVFINGAMVANVYGVDLKECILARFATDEQWVECEHLKVTSKE